MGLVDGAAGSRKLGLWLLLFAEAITVPILIFAVWNCRQPRAHSLEDVSSWLKLNEVALADHAHRILAGEVEQEPGRVIYPPPARQTGELRVTAVTKDDNNNVYFILSGSFVTFNVGLVLRNGDKELLGDQCEPSVGFRRHIRDRWWHYESGHGRKPAVLKGEDARSDAPE